MGETEQGVFERADRVEMLNRHLGGFANVMGLRFVEIEPERVVAELEIGEQHLQPYGLVHGGVFASMIESVCSSGAALSVLDDGKSAVGLDNSTAFLRAARSGKLRCIARPLRRGRRTHVWDAEVRDHRDRLLASGRVRLMILESDDRAGGDIVELRSQEE